MRIAVLIVSIFALLALVATALNDAQVGRYEAMIMTGGTGIRCAGFMTQGAWKSDNGAGHVLDGQDSGLCDSTWLSCRCESDS